METPCDNPVVVHVMNSQGEALLTRCQRTVETTTVPSEAVLYLHGFPDQSLDHRAQCRGEFGSRFPRKLFAFLADSSCDVLFTAFNCSGTPGSEGSFETKTVSQELADAKCVIAFLRAKVDKIHVIGLSTGAILAALLRSHPGVASVTTVAGLLDPLQGVHLDFSDEQLNHMQERGWCEKEFWLYDSVDNPPCLDDVAPYEGVKKRFLRLNDTYTRDFCTLNIAAAVETGPPLLVVHGLADKDVPIAHGEALFTHAAEPKTFHAIKGGNHLLTNTKHFTSMCKAFLAHISNT